MTNGFTTLLLLTLTLSCGKGFKKESSQTERQQENQQTDNYSINQEYITLLNNHRMGKGLSALTYSAFIEEEAVKHSKAMALRLRSFGHFGFSLRCQKIQGRLGPIKLCGEVVSMGHKTSKAVMNSWLESSFHRRELESEDYTHTAIGVYSSPNGVNYWTQIFVER